MLFGVYLSAKITRQTKCAIGGVTSGRPNLKYEKLIGMFVNTVMYKYELNEVEIFDDFAKSCKNDFSKY